MLKRCVAAEWLKMRHSKMLLILMVLPVFSILIGSANYYFNRSVLQDGWYSLWTQVSLFYGEFFLPVLIAICCAYICRIEHMNKNWYTVMTAPLSSAHVFIAKLVIVAWLVFVVQLFFTLLYYGAGRWLGLQAQMPFEIFRWVMLGWFASLSICAVQLSLSMRIKSFAVPIGISICAVFIGLGLYVANLGVLFPYSLLTIGMGVLSQESLSPNSFSAFLVMNVLFIVIFSTLSIRWLSRTDVTA